MSGHENLEIHEYLELEELRLAHLSCLKTISVENCDYLKTVSRISNLAKLVELNISDCHMLELEHLDLSGLKFLERVRIDGCVKMENFEFDGCEKLREIIFDCKNVVKLSIRDCAQLEKLADLIVLSFLKKIIIDGCGNLKHLRLHSLENLGNVSDNMELRQMNIINCPMLEELPCLDKMCCLDQIKIDCCEKIQHIILPTSLVKLDVQSCRVLQRVAVAGDLTELTQLIIKQCPTLEELPGIAGVRDLAEIEIDFIKDLQKITLPTRCLSLNIIGCGDLQRKRGILIRRGHIELYITVYPKLDLRHLCSLSCLEKIAISSCEKLQNITLPTTLVMLDVRNCIDLQRIEGISDLKTLVIRQCPALDFLRLCSLSCLEITEIWSSEKLENITLPTTLSKLDVRKCSDLQGIAGTSDLQRLVIGQCPALEELPSPSELNCLEEIDIWSCEKLQNIPLPTTLSKLDVYRCTLLQGLAGMAALIKLSLLHIAECPALELPCLGRLTCLERFEIDSCENLQIISGIEELHVPKYTRLTYCGYAVTRYFIDRWKSLPMFTFLIGKAVDGAESSLKECLLSEANIAVDGVTEISTDTGNLYRDWSGLRTVILCFVVAIDSSALAKRINKNISCYLGNDFLKMRQGESLVTVVESSEYSEDETWELLTYYYTIMKKGFRVDLKEGEEWKSLPVLRTIVDRLYDKE